jgi:hypothetical protein
MSHNPDARRCYCEDCVGLRWKDREASISGKRAAAMSRATLRRTARFK